MKILMSIKLKFIEWIFARTKTFELRKKLFKKAVDTIIIYSSFPEKRLLEKLL